MEVGELSIVKEKIETEYVLSSWLFNIFVDKGIKEHITEDREFDDLENYNRLGRLKVKNEWERSERNGEILIVGDNERRWRNSSSEGKASIGGKCKIVWRSMKKRK